VDGQVLTLVAGAAVWTAKTVIQDLITMASSGTTTTVFTAGAPTISQGRSIASITITPTEVGTRLVVRGHLNGALSAAYSGTRCALFKDGASATIASNIIEQLTATWHCEVNVLYFMTTTSLTPVTFEARGGSETAGTFTIEAGSYLEVQELAP
jgi:hypothetical protein